jgi:hypothetical protein
MKTPTSSQNLSFVAKIVLWTGLLAISGIAHAQAPGQDTIVLKTAPAQGGGGGSPERAGKGLEEKQDMPISLKAKIARYTAMGMAKGEESQYAQNLVQQADSAGFNKTCVQDIGGTTAPTGLGTGRYGPRNQEQVLVLRGDFINVCR